MTATTKIKRPKFMQHITDTPTTTRVCPEDGCGRPATLVTGHYLVEARRVRVWSCREHWSGNPQLVVPTPPSIAAAIRAEEEYRVEVMKKYRYVGPEYGVSVKVLASSGHGEPIPGDRVKAWRWGG